MNSIPNMETQRLRSLKKVTDAWKGIIKKYSQLHDEEQGDIIDIRTGALIEDSGHLKSLRDSAQIKEDVWKSLNNSDSGDLDSDSQNSNHLGNKNKHRDVSETVSNISNTFTSIPLNSDSDMETIPTWYTLTQPGTRRRTTRSSISQKDNLRVVPLKTFRKPNKASSAGIKKTKRHNYPHDQLKLSGLNIYDSQSYKDSNSLVKSMPIDAVGPLITPSKVKRFKEALENKNQGNVRLKKLLLINRQKRWAHHRLNHNHNKNPSNTPIIQHFLIEEKSKPANDIKNNDSSMHSTVGTGDSIPRSKVPKITDSKTMFKEQEKLENFIQESTGSPSTMNKSQVIKFLSSRMGLLPRKRNGFRNIEEIPHRRLRGHSRTQIVLDNDDKEDKDFIPDGFDISQGPVEIPSSSKTRLQTSSDIDKRLENSDSEDDLEITGFRNVENVDATFLANEILYEEDTFFPTKGDKETTHAQPTQSNENSQAHAEMTKFTIDAMREDSSDVSESDNANRLDFQEEERSRLMLKLDKEQLSALKTTFKLNPTPNHRQIMSIATETGLTYSLIFKWFSYENSFVADQAKSPS